MLTKADNLKPGLPSGEGCFSCLFPVGGGANRNDHDSRGAFLPYNEYASTLQNTPHRSSPRGESAGNRAAFSQEGLQFSVGGNIL